MCAGKTTVGGLLAQKLGLPYYDLDDRRWAYYEEVGYDKALADQIRQEAGFNGLYQYWKPFEAHAVERVVTDCPDGVISFGAGHSVYTDSALFARVAQALAPCRHVFLLLPSKDLAEAQAILAQRFRKLGEAEGFEPDPQTLALNAHFLHHPSNRRLASHTVYTDGQTPAQTCETILRLVASNPES